MMKRFFVYLIALSMPAIAFFWVLFLPAVGLLYLTGFLH